MSSKACSPAAQLLRQSRLFAVPPPVASPIVTDVKVVRRTPYPTLQAITSPASSASRGDWGLKRDLPAKAHKKAEYLRYNDLDTWAHMTTFESAHDEVLTLKKYQELDFALMTGAPIPRFIERSPSMKARVAPESDDFDTIMNVKNYTRQQAEDLYKDFGTEGAGFRHKINVFSFNSANPTQEAYKWRYEAPSVHNMNEREVSQFIAHYISPRREEFLRFVAVQKRAVALEKEFKNQGVPESQIMEEAVRLESENPTEVDIMQLRHGSRDELDRYVTRFFDIPEKGQETSTHPSAGLHYTRSNSYAHHGSNFAALEQARPVPGRVLNMSASKAPLAGVAGIVSKVSSKALDKMIKGKSDRQRVVYFRPIRTEINNKGRILFDVERLGLLEPSGFKWWDQLVGERMDARDTRDVQDAQPFNTVHKLSRLAAQAQAAREGLMQGKSDSRRAFEQIGTGGPSRGGRVWPVAGRGAGEEFQYQAVRRPVGLDFQMGAGQSERDSRNRGEFDHDTDGPRGQGRFGGYNGRR